MTRKRFIKLLMSYGYRRNAAQLIAESVNKRKLPYKNAIKFYRLKNALGNISKAAVNVAKYGTWERFRNIFEKK